jgi:hypothetical protein
MQPKIILASVLGAACLGGGALTVSASAASRTTTPAAVSAQVAPEPTDDSAAPSGSPADDRPAPGTRLGEVLAPLVADGTLTQAQADAVVAAMVAAHTDHAGEGGGRGRSGPSLDAAATVLGLTADELRTQLRAGATLADIAAAQGVEVSAVIDALVAEATTRLAQAVTDGKLTQAEADAKLADIEARITQFVNEGGPLGGGGRPGHGDDGDADDAPAPGTEVPTTTAG